jgi:chorismate mutase/prephenate dehydratase
MDDLKQLRMKIDALDEKVLRLLGERVQICKAIGASKKKKGLPVRDNDRENEVYKHIKAKAADFAVDPVQVEAVYREIVNMCSDVQVKEKNE